MRFNYELRITNYDTILPVSQRPSARSHRRRRAETKGRFTLRWLLLSLILLPFVARAQYYDQGAAPGSLRWKQLRTDHDRIIFPDGYEQGAIALKQLLDTLRPAVGFGYRHGALRMPIVLQTHNFASNGLVMRAPTRMELIVAPPAAMTPEPWLRQLAAHESRHAVQYRNVDRHLVRGLSWLLGDQGALVGVGLFPLWALEGDAVMAETELSTFGRGLQPSFTIDYRAIVGENRLRWSSDKWFSGSYKDHLPDHYALGYQLVSYAYTKLGENPWERVADYSSRRPYLILTARAALWKYYRTSIRQLLRETLADLDTYWSSLPPVEPTGHVVPTPVTSYTRYGSPLAIDEKIVAVKADLDRPERLVVVTPQGERTRFGLGTLNSPLAYDPASGRLYWSELRRSKFWGQRVNSQLLYADLDGGRPRAVHGARQALFPTPTGDGRVAYVHYDYDGTYSIRIVGGEKLAEFPLLTSLHGLACDSGALYFLAVDEGGMWIGQAGGSEPVKARGYSTLSDLRAADGVLFFTSTQSGRDEAHALDLATGREWRITASEFGSFAPAPAGDSILATTFTSTGYLISKHPVERTRPVPRTAMPVNLVNPPRTHWETALGIDPLPLADTTGPKIKRYRKLPHALNIHSWAPVAFDPNAVASETSPDIRAGVTLLSQDVLSTTVLTARWGIREGRSFFGAGLEYGGLPVKLSLSTDIGGGRQLVYGPTNARLPRLKNYFEIDARAYLPILFDRGSHARMLQPSVEYQHYNALLFSDSIAFSRGVHKVVGDLYWGDNVRLAPRDFLPRWGYALRATTAFNPFNNDFSIYLGLWGRLYLPGLAPHHSTMLRAAAQRQSDDTYHFTQKLLYPRGADYRIVPRRYIAGAIDYQFPIAYPDGGIPSILYIKRVRLNLAAYGARYQAFDRERSWHETGSYGGDLTLDINLLRAPAAATNSITFSLYKPSDRKGLFWGFGLTLPI